MAKKCNICNSNYNPKLSECPKKNCQQAKAKKDAADKVAAENRKLENAPHRMRVRRPLKRGKFGRGPKNG